jgi:hypothetical protein
LLLVAAAACTPERRADPAPIDRPAPVASPAPTPEPAVPAPEPAAPPPPAFPCGPARTLGSGEQLLAALSPEWPRPGIGLSPVSVDLVADVDLVANSDGLPLPAYCRARCTHRPREVRCEGTGDACRAPVRFRLNEAVAGVLVDGQSYAHEGTKLKIKAGTRFRLVQRVHEYHPETPYYDPVITVVHACDTPCTAQQRRCDATGLCVSTEGDSYCLLCEGLGRPECACRTPEGGRKDDGTECTYLSGDYFPTGVCAGGRCDVSH